MENRDDSLEGGGCPRRLVLLFEQDGFYAVENYDRHGNIHRICQVKGGKVRYMANEWLPVEDYFTDHDGQEWEGLKVVYLPEFSEQNVESIHPESKP